MTRLFALGFFAGLVTAMLALSAAMAHAAGPDCRIGIPSSRDCPAAIVSPPGLPSHGGTVTVHPGISEPCIVRLPGGAKLCAGGETAAPYPPPGQLAPPGRAIFRVSGAGLDTPGVNIVVSRSATNAPNGPELLPQLAADALIILPPDAELLRFDPASGRYVPVPSGHIRQAGDTLYKILRRGAAPVITAASPPLPRMLPATGSSPVGPLLALAACLIGAGLWLGRGVLWRRNGRTSERRQGSDAWIGTVLASAGLVLAVATGVGYTYLSTQAGTAGFGTLDATGGSSARDGGAAGPPSRLVIRRLGIDTPVVPLGVAGGAWQIPVYAAGFLDVGVWPGHRGNEAITGHDDRDGAVFRRLHELHAGDLVQVYAGTRVYRYTVTALHTVPATRVDVLRPTRGAVLTLITCTPYLVDTQRLVARAQLVASG